MSSPQTGGRLDESALPRPYSGAAHDALVERLAAHRMLGAAPRHELAWLAAHGHLEDLRAGEVVSTPATPMTAMYVLLSGRISIHLMRDSTRHKVAEWRGGDVTGLLPYSRLVTPPGDSIVEESGEMLAIPREHVRALTREGPEVTAIVVHVMLDRARLFSSTMLHDEKLRSLGKLAAGLAHELNNPAAAITRFAKTLRACIDTLETAARAIGGAGLTPAELEAVQGAANACRAAPLEHVRSPLEEAEREALIADWLDDRGIDATSAESVAQSPITLDALEALTRGVRAEVIGPVLQWIAAHCSTYRLAREIEQAGTRISDLVTAVRGFTQVDASSAPQPVNIRAGLEQTLAVLGGKARGRSVRITLDVEENLPAVRGVAAELNQVWANLVDNALDAAPATAGSVDVTAGRRGDRVVVRVADNGAGIPADVRNRMFDPFFTTKDVGKGTGLGLDIVRRLVDRHDGDIEVVSEPGRTEFIVSLPLARQGVSELEA